MHKISLYDLISEKKSKSQVFNDETKINKFDTIIKEYPEIWGIIHFKEYSRLKKVYLPKKFSKKVLNLEKIIKNRRSIRKFSNKPISLNDISRILFYSSGLTYLHHNWNKTRRAYPSAGARYPLELYLIILKETKGLKKGIYHYNVRKHALELLLAGDYKVKICEYVNQKWVKRASVIIIITAIFDRTKIKYGERGYRYVFLDAGHLSQNIHLISTGLNLGCCAIGGFLDNEIGELLDLDNEKEAVIYINVIGNGCGTKLANKE